MLSAEVEAVALSLHSSPQPALQPSGLASDPLDRAVCPAHTWQSVPDCQDEQVWLTKLAAAFAFSEIKKESELWPQLK